MRPLALTAVVAAFVLLSAGPTAAGTRFVEVDDYATAGDTVTARIEITNDSGKAGKFKVTARVRGDPQMTSGKAAKSKGKKLRFSVRLEAGETTIREFDLAVPGTALGPMLVDCKVKGPDGRLRVQEPCYGMPAEWRDGPTGEPGGGPGEERPEDSITVAGTIRLSPEARPGVEKELGFAPFTLEIRAEGGKNWGLFGHEAEFLARLMLDAEVTETTGSVTGIPMGILPLKRNSRGDENAIYVLEWEARGIEDPRARLVPFWSILSERISKITEAKELVATDEDGWDRLLASAGIRFPEVPVFREDPGLPGPPEVGMERVGGQAPWDVDFDRMTIVAIFAGEKRSTGYRVRVVSVTKENDETLLVRWTLDEPSEYEVVIEVPTRPFAIAAVVAAGKRFRFEYTERESEPFFPPSWGGPEVPPEERR